MVGPMPSSSFIAGTTIATLGRSPVAVEGRYMRLRAKRLSR